VEAAPTEAANCAIVPAPDVSRHSPLITRHFFNQNPRRPKLKPPNPAKQYVVTRERAINLANPPTWRKIPKMVLDKIRTLLLTLAGRKVRPSTATQTPYRTQKLVVKW